ncbi:MAG: serine/threonine-protein phosphatase [Zavarzinella sp.]|nr:serine/threonine-protein phosphatase [Zavarzinella sp.]
MSDPRDTDTIEEFVPLPPSAAEPPHSASAGVMIDLGAATDPGKARPNNEDHYLVVRFGRAMELLRSNLPLGQVPLEFGDMGYGMAVADGMGGAAGGEVASSLAIVAGLNLALNHPKWTLVITPEELRENIDRWRDRFHQIDAVLAARAKSDPSLAGMGTTLTVAASIGPHLLLYHVGDSRAYLFRDGRLHRLTRDHTYAQDLADAGRIDPAAVPGHRLRHVLTRVIGKGSGAAEADIECFPLADADQVLLCTDGLNEMVGDNQIADTLARSPTADIACRNLVDLALDAGGKDNVTVVLARYLIPAGSAHE